MAAALVIAPVCAQESPRPNQTTEAAEPAGEKPGMEVWKWINFALLAGVLAWLIAKNAGPMLAARSKRIQEDLAAGERASKEAQARAAQVQKKLATLDVEIEAMRQAVREERDREAERIRKDAHAEIARIRLHVEQELEAAGKQARLEVQRFAAKLAIDLAESKIRARMSPDAQQVLIDNFLGDLRDGAARAQTT
jgi:F-type H+-transporting ATPase subunit b